MARVRENDFARQRVERRRLKRAHRTSATNGSGRFAVLDAQMRQENSMARKKNQMRRVVGRTVLGPVLVAMEALCVSLLAVQNAET